MNLTFEVFQESHGANSILIPHLFGMVQVIFLLHGRIEMVHGVADMAG